MIRTSQININYANRDKIDQLNCFCKEAVRVINLYIDILWEKKEFNSKFVKDKVDTWLSARMQQCLGKQALEIVKSQRKKKNKTKPVFTRHSFNLDSRFVKIEQDVNSFDIWITLTSLGNRLKIVLPGKKHKHFNKFSGWKLKKSIRLRCVNGKYYIDVYFEKPPKNKKKFGKELGLDVGYKKLIATSDYKTYGHEMESVYEKISRKKQGSKAFKRALAERDNKTNQFINQLPLRRTKILVVENLKNLKQKTKGKLRKTFVNKMQRWSYRDVLGRLALLSEELGFDFEKIDPAYTSQRCSACGVICKSNRQGEIYKCACGLFLDADINASLNILHLGVYSPQASYIKKDK